MTETRRPIFKSLVLVKDFITLVLAFPNCGLPFLCFQIMILRVVFRFRQFRFNLKNWHLIKILNISSVISNTKKGRAYFGNAGTRRIFNNCFKNSTLYTNVYKQCRELFQRSKMII